MSFTSCRIEEEIKNKSILDLKDSLLLHHVKSFVLGLKNLQASVRERLEQNSEIRLVLCDVGLNLGGYLSIVSSGHSLKSPQRIVYESKYLFCSPFSLEITSLNKTLLEA